MTRRPPRLATFEYIGRYRYSLTYCTFRRLRLFTTDTTVSDMIGQIVHASCDWRFAVLAYCFMPDYLHLLKDYPFSGSLAWSEDQLGDLW